MSQPVRMKTYKPVPIVEPPDALDVYFTDTIEPVVRLSRGGEDLTPRANKLAIATLVGGAVAVAAWLLEAPVWIYGPVFVVAGAALLGTLQLRSGASGMTATQIRDHLVESLATFHGYEHQRSPTSEEVDAVFSDAGSISWTLISQRMDMIAGESDGIRFHGVQIIGGVGVSRPGPDWLGISVDDLTERFTVDGLLLRFDLPFTVHSPVTISNDRRLTYLDEPDASVVTLSSPESGDAAFDEEFRIVGQWTDELKQTLRGTLPAALLQLARELGPTTVEMRGNQAWASVWSIGDLYTLTSLGSALHPQTRRLSAIMSAPERVAEALRT
jgi:hypothetical protein